MPFRQDDAGTPVFFGSGGHNTEILKINKRDGGNHISNVFPKGRYDTEEAALLTILQSIGEDDKGTEDFIQYWVATSAGIDGLRVGEYIQLCTGMLVPGSMPQNPGMKQRLFGRDGHGKVGAQNKKQNAEEHE